MFQAKGAKKRWQDSRRPAIMGHITETKVSAIQGEASVTKVQEKLQLELGSRKGWCYKGKRLECPKGRAPKVAGRTFSLPC